MLSVESAFQHHVEAAQISEIALTDISALIGGDTPISPSGS